VTVWLLSLVYFYQSFPVLSKAISEQDLIFASPRKAIDVVSGPWIQTATKQRYHDPSGFGFGLGLAYIFRSIDKGKNLREKRRNDNGNAGRYSSRDERRKLITK
jgi:hypothetical protein